MRSEVCSASAVLVLAFVGPFVWFLLAFFLTRDTGGLRTLSEVMDEMPFMDTDIARGVLLLTLENFAFFCSEFGISSLGPGMSVTDMDGVQFVALQFVELGGDHLDRLVRFTAAHHDIGAVRASEIDTRLAAEQSVFLQHFYRHGGGMGRGKKTEDEDQELWGVPCVFVCVLARVVVLGGGGRVVTG